MGFDFASAKALVRRTTMAVFGVRAFYEDDSVGTPIETRARLHDKIAQPMGDLDGEGYALITESADRIIFEPVDVDGFPFEPKRLGRFTFPDTHPDEVITLEHRQPSLGGTRQIWTVTRGPK